jgi:hypothetical protein
MTKTYTILYKLILLLLLTTTINTQWIDDDGIGELFEGYAESKMANQGQVVYFLHIREHMQKANVNYHTRVIQDFLLTIHKPARVVNWQNHDMVIVVGPDHVFDINILLEQFVDWFDKGGVRTSSEFQKTNEL